MYVFIFLFLKLSNIHSFKNSIQHAQQFVYLFKLLSCGLYSGGEKKACALDVGRLWAWSAESVRWEEKQKQNPHAIVPLYSCGLGQLISGRKNIQGLR